MDNEPAYLSSQGGGPMLPRDRVAKPVLGMAIVVWLILTSTVLWMPRAEMQQAGREVRRVAAVAVPSSKPSQLLIFEGNNWHLFLFFGLAVLVTCYPHRLGWRAVLVLVCLLTAYSLLTEIVQELFVPGRSFEWHDMGLDQVAIIGGMTSAGIARGFREWVALRRL